MKLKLNKDRSKKVVEKIQLYMEKEYGEAIGELRAAFLLDFFVEELGPLIYNQAINDAQAFLQDKLIDLETALTFAER